MADAVRVGVAHGQDTFDYGAGVELDRRDPLRRFETWMLTSHFEFGGGEFQGHRGAISHNSVRALAALGALRMERAPWVGLQAFGDVGLGMGGLSEVTINGDRHFSSAFQFTEILRMGVRFGDRRQYELAIGGQHFSNAGLRRPNDGITYGGVTAAWYWR